MPPLCGLLLYLGTSYLFYLCLHLYVRGNLQKSLHLVYLRFFSLKETLILFERINKKHNQNPPQCWTGGKDLLNTSAFYMKKLFIIAFFLSICLTETNQNRFNSDDIANIPFFAENTR